MFPKNIDSKVFSQIPAESLRKLGQTVPARAAINRITNDVLAITWQVVFDACRQEKAPGNLPGAASFIELDISS